MKRFILLVVLIGVIHATGFAQEGRNDTSSVADVMQTFYIGPSFK